MLNLNFRKDINGLRAIAVIAVVLFHFNPAWAPGGFVGVDIFFVISGFLMTGIIFRDIENNNFSYLNFYIARANRIIPALAVLCFVLLVLGWFFLVPFDYRQLGKQAASSMGFLSNFIYWIDAGYFDAVSRDKWLLHTWSLSVEWQFYILYPVFLVGMKYMVSLKTLRYIVLILTFISFIGNLVITNFWPESAYFLLPGRVWEMLVGAIAYLYPADLNNKYKNKLECLGLLLIIFSCIFITSKDIWPGLLVIFPVSGAFLLIQAQNFNSVITGNYVLQRIGYYSYSIYLWHWPIVVILYKFDLTGVLYSLIGILCSLLLGLISYYSIERKKYNISFNNGSVLACKPMYMSLAIGIIGSAIYIFNGVPVRVTNEVNNIDKQMLSSPYRNDCHTGGEAYIKPKDACEYFGSDVTWAIIGDSHTVEIAYALANKLKVKDIGLKHFSFSGCIPSYTQSDSFSVCAKWYNDVIDRVLADDKIQNIVINHRYSEAIFGDNIKAYPKLPTIASPKTSEILKSIDRLLLVLSNKKKHIYIFKPIPELGNSIANLIGKPYLKGESLDFIVGTTRLYYENRNKFVNNYFDLAQYPRNVKVIDPSDAFCDTSSCFAVRYGKALYFDDDHPSVEGAILLVDLMGLSE